MSSPIQVTLLSIVPSPYQRDLFAALSRQPELNLKVYYAESASPDSPWPAEPLRPFEQVLPGFHLSLGSMRFIINTRLPKPPATGVLVMNGYNTLLAQTLYRRKRKDSPVIFWGEKMARSKGGLRGTAQTWLSKPLKSSAAIVAIGKAAAQDYSERYPGKKVYELPYYCDLSPFRDLQIDRPRQPVTFLFCGQMIKRKGIDLLLQAFSRIIIEDNFPARLLLVGREAELPELLKLLPQKVRENVDYAGFQAPKDLPAFFKQGDVFVLPSRYDGWGVVVNQALGAGLPVICSDAVGSAFDLVEHGVNGYIFPTGDVDALTLCMRTFAKDTQLVESASAASVQASLMIDPDEGARRWVTILKEVLQS